MKSNIVRSPSPKTSREKVNPKIKITKDDLDTNKFKDMMNNGKSNILVAVRCRPLSKKEIEVSTIETVKILNHKIVIVLDPIEYNGHEEVFKNRSKEQQYAFDYAFEKNSSQHEIYENTSKFLIPGLLQGFNATVFAYGATGAGKTYTMLGTGSDPGLMVRSLVELFSTIENTRNREFKIKLTYLEVYNETIRDLLGNGENLEMREDPAKGTMIAGINELEVNTSTEVFELLLRGNKKRTTEATNMNETSSRSHAVLQILIENKSNNSSSNNEIVSGKFILVDLAGSERASNSQNTGIRLVEGANINKSLLALGNCINALVDISNGSNKSFIPWRDSKLTRILKDSLGGNSRIVMIANISPSIFSFEDTLNTLKYANRAKNIKTSVKRNVLDVDFHINKYDEVISNLKKELETLRHQLAVKTHNTHLTKSSNEEKNNPLNKIDKINKDIANHFQEEIRVKKEIIEEEKKIDGLTFEFKEKEYEMFKQINMGINSKERGSGLKQKELKNSLNKINEQIEFRKASLNEKISIQNELINKRGELENQIAKYSKEPLGNSLNLTYQYYIVLLDNMTIDHKKNLNINHLRQKEVKLNKLIDQIKIRDDFIQNAKNELNKKGLKIKEPDEIKSLENLNIEHNLVLPIVISSNQVKNDIKNIPAPNNNNFLKISSAKDSSNDFNNSRSKSPYQSYNNPNIIKEKRKFKSKTTEIIEKAKKKALTELKLNVINDLYPNSKVYYLNSNNPNRKISQNRLNSVIALDTRNLNSSHDRRNTSMHSRTSEVSYRSVKTIKEREIDKKVKSIIKKGLVGRHKNSPYLKNFNEL